MAFTHSVCLLRHLTSFTYGRTTRVELLELLDPNYFHFVIGLYPVAHSWLLSDVILGQCRSDTMKLRIRRKCSIKLFY